jgi:hypothetical protein
LPELPEVNKSGPELPELPEVNKSGPELPELLSNLTKKTKNCGRKIG